MEKLLVVTYYWPPSGGGGVQRWLKLTKYLPSCGVVPIVYTPKNPAFALKDYSLLKDIAPEVEVWKRSIFEPYRLLSKRSALLRTQQVHTWARNRQGFKQRLLVALRANLFVPDPRITWVGPSTRYLNRALRLNPLIKYVITTGPPHSLHLIGERLKRRHPHVKWVADFRDCWTQWEVLRALKPLSMVWRKHERLEKRIVTRCDGLLTVSPSWESEFQKMGAKQTHTLYNGYDPEDFKGRAPAPSAAQFVLVHLGHLNKARSHAFLCALAQLCSENVNFAKNLALHIGGDVQEGVRACVEARPAIASRTKWLGYVPHENVAQQYAKASVLLLFSERSPSGYGHLPGKFFEYLAAKRPILAMTHPTGTLATWIKKTQSGYSAPQDDIQAIAACLRTLYAERQKKHSFHTRRSQAFSRPQQAADLLRWLRTLP